jgi:hypothetical protein
MTQQLPEAVRTSLRFMRHDLAGRVHVLLAAIELYSNDDYSGSGTDDALQLLREVEQNWRGELRRLDDLLVGTPSPFPVTAHGLSEILGIVVSDGNYLCDPAPLSAAIKHGHKAIGRASLFAHTTTLDRSTHGLVLSLRSGTCGDQEQGPLHEVLPGDGDAYLCEAEAGLAGVKVTAARDTDGVVLCFVIPHAPLF